MPIYEYVCPKCGEGFEKLVRAGFKGAAECPKCGHQSERKQVSLFGLTGGSPSFNLSSAANCAPSG